jgi:hypothetical protein
MLYLQKAIQSLKLLASVVKSVYLCKRDSLIEVDKLKAVEVRGGYVRVHWYGRENCMLLYDCSESAEYSWFSLPGRLRLYRAVTATLL